MQDNNEKMLILQIVYWLHIYYTIKYITSTPKNTHGKQRNVENWIRKESLLRKERTNNNKLIYSIYNRRKNLEIE